jgi:ATP synthase protein I
VANAEPEREAVRRALPWAPVALLLSFALGRIFGGADAAWSAAIAVVIVFVNFVAAALSVAWAAHISPAILFAVAMGGFLVRLIVYTVALVLLNTLTWFSPVAFALTLVPVMIGLLVLEARTLSGRLQADMWSFREAAEGAAG